MEWGHQHQEVHILCWKRCNALCNHFSSFQNYNSDILFNFLCVVCFLNLLLYVLCLSFIERTGKFVRDREVLTAAVIPLTPNFQYVIGFAKLDVSRECISYGEGGFYLFFASFWNKYCQKRIACRRVYFISLWILFPGAFNTSEHVSSQKVITDGWIGKFVEIRGLVQILGITLPFF